MQRVHHLEQGAKAAVRGGESLFNWGKSTAGQSAQPIHLSPFLEANVGTVVAVTNKILRNDRVGITHEYRTPPAGVEGGRIDLSQFLGGWFSHSKWGLPVIANARNRFAPCRDDMSSGVSGFGKAGSAMAGLHGCR